MMVDVTNFCKTSGFFFKLAFVNHPQISQNLTLAIFISIIGTNRQEYIISYPGKKKRDNHICIILYIF